MGDRDSGGLTDAILFGDIDFVPIEEEVPSHNDHQAETFQEVQKSVGGLLGGKVAGGRISGAEADHIRQKLNQIDVVGSVEPILDEKLSRGEISQQEYDTLVSVNERLELQSPPMSDTQQQSDSMASEVTPDDTTPAPPPKKADSKQHRPSLARGTINPNNNVVFVGAKIPRLDKKMIDGKEVIFFEVHLRQETSTESLIQSAAQMSLGYDTVNVPERRVWVRYSQFEGLNQELILIPSVKQNLPAFPKKLIVHSDANLEMRRCALERWLSTAISLSLRPAYSQYGYCEFDKMQKVLLDWCLMTIEVSQKQEDKEMDWKDLSDKIADEIYAAEQARDG